MRPHLRFALVAGLIAATAFVLQARGGNDVIAPRQSFDSFPDQLGGWTGTHVPIPQDDLQVLGQGDFMLRDYQSADPQQPYIELFLAYFPSQRTGDNIHSPKNCLPGAGWSPVESSRVLVSLLSQPPFPANRYVIAKGDARELVFYWYLAHDRALANEYWAKFYLVSDAIRLNRSDGALIRVTTPMPAGEKADTAQQRLFSFMEGVVPVLPQYVPR
jgi:EpsI family protein